MTFPSSAPLVPLPPCALFRFLFAVSTKEVRVGARLGGRVTTGTAREEPLAWAVSKARRSSIFSSNPMPSRMLVASWLALTFAGFRCGLEVLGASVGSSY